ncbi:hypothetical protein F511_00161 [Dorcoceras hygrometricum]|nr:hypothetical protein F511_00161 [Dorcoceras hygrometricum]
MRTTPRQARRASTRIVTQPTPSKRRPATSLCPAMARSSERSVATLGGATSRVQRGRVARPERNIAQRFARNCRNFGRPCASSTRGGAPPCTVAPWPFPKNFVGIQLAVGPQPLWLRNHNSGPAQRIMVKRLATSPHDPIGITDSACKNQLVVVSIQYGPFNPYIPIRSTTIDITGYPRMSASGESSTTMHRLLHASGSHPIPMPYDPKRVGKRVKVRRLSCRVSMTFRVVRTNQYNQDLGLIHSTNGNHLESPNEGSSIDHQVTIYLHAQNITMFPTNETWSTSLVQDQFSVFQVQSDHKRSTKNSAERPDERPASGIVIPEPQWLWVHG